MCVCSSWTVLVGSRPSVSLCCPKICVPACLSVYQPAVGPVVSGANGVFDYHPLEVVGLSPATLHLVTWIGLGFGLGPGRGSGPGLRCGLPYCKPGAPNPNPYPNLNPNPNPNSNPNSNPNTCEPGARGSLIAKGARAAHTRASAPDAQRRL